MAILSRSYRQAAADQRREARRAAVACDVTGDKVIDDAAAGWRVVTTTVLALLAVILVALGIYEAASHSARSIPLLLVGVVFVAAAVRSGAKLAVLRRRRQRALSGDPG